MLTTGSQSLILVALGSSQESAACESRPSCSTSVAPSLAQQVQQLGKTLGVEFFSTALPPASKPPKLVKPSFRTRNNAVEDVRRHANHLPALPIRLIVADRCRGGQVMPVNLAENASWLRRIDSNLDR